MYYISIFWVVFLDTHPFFNYALLEVFKRKLLHRLSPCVHSTPSVSHYFVHSKMNSNNSVWVLCVEGSTVIGTSDRGERFLPKRCDSKLESSREDRTWRPLAYVRQTTEQNLICRHKICYWRVGLHNKLKLIGSTSFSPTQYFIT